MQNLSSKQIAARDLTANRKAMAYARAFPDMESRQVRRAKERQFKKTEAAAAKKAALMAKRLT